MFCTNLSAVGNHFTTGRLKIEEEKNHRGKKMDMDNKDCSFNRLKGMIINLKNS